MKRVFVAATVSALVLGLTLSGYAQRRKAKPEEPQKPAELKLSEEQKEKLAAIHREGAKEQIRLGAERRIAQMELQELLQSDRPDQTAVGRKIDQLADLNRQMTENRLHHAAEARSVLTREQWNALHRRMARGMMFRNRERMRILRFRGPGGPFHPGMGPGSGGRPMGDESFQPGNPTPEDMSRLDEFDGLGFLQPGDPEDFNPADDQPLIEEQAPPSPPTDDNWQ